MLSSPGIGSGLDVKSIVDQLMAVEKRPLLKLDAKEAGLQAKISGIGQLKSAISSFQSSVKGLSQVSKFLVFDATSSEENVLTVSASSNAAKGAYQMEVKRIAENHRMVTRTAFANVDTGAIGATGDTMTIQVGADVFSVEIGGKTLADVRNAINKATNNAGVTASVISVDGGSRLLLSANSTGSNHALMVSYSGADPFGLEALNQDRNGDSAFTAADLDAELALEGRYTVTRSSNSIGDVIQGVTLNLKGPGTTAVSVEQDTGVVKKAVEEFTGAYNKLMTVINELRQQGLMEESAKLGAIQAQFRLVLNTPAALDSHFTSLFEIGVKSNVQIGSQTDAQGDISLDTEKLNKAIENDIAGIVSLFTDEKEGFSSRLEALADKLLGSDGPLDSRTKSLGSQIEQVNKRRAQLEKRLDMVETRLLKQFSTLDSLLGSLQTTSSYLSQQLKVLQEP